MAVPPLPTKHATLPVAAAHAGAWRRPQGPVRMSLMRRPIHTRTCPVCGAAPATVVWSIHEVRDSPLALVLASTTVAGLLALGLALKMLVLGALGLPVVGAAFLKVRQRLTLTVDCCVPCRDAWASAQSTQAWLRRGAALVAVGGALAGLAADAWVLVVGTSSGALALLAWSQTVGGGRFPTLRRLAGRKRSQLVVGVPALFQSVLEEEDPDVVVVDSHG
jgi:hypothetical protein